MKWSIAILLVMTMPGLAQAEPYPKEVREAFLEACSVSGDAAVCACVLERLEAEVPIAGLGEVSDAQVEGYLSGCTGTEKQVKREADPRVEALCEAHSAEDNLEMCMQSLSQLRSALGPELWEAYATCASGLEPDEASDIAAACMTSAMRERLGAEPLQKEKPSPKP